MPKKSTSNQTILTTVIIVAVLFLALMIRSVKMSRLPQSDALAVIMILLVVIVSAVILWWGVKDDDKKNKHVR